MRLLLVRKKQVLTLGTSMQILWSGLYPHLHQNIHLKYYPSRKSGISPLLTNEKLETKASLKSGALVINSCTLIWPTVEL